MPFADDFLPLRVVVVLSICELLRVIGPRLPCTQRFGNRKHVIYSKNRWCCSERFNCFWRVCFTSWGEIFWLGGSLPLSVGKAGGRDAGLVRSINFGCFSGSSM